MQQASTLSKKLASYSALTTVVLAAAKQADAQILYTDIIPDTTIEVVGIYLMDLNNDGITDFKFNAKHGNNTAINQLRVIAYGLNGVDRDTTLNSGTYDGYYYAFALYYGDPIGGSKSFEKSMILGSLSGAHFGNWFGVEDGYLGLKLELNSNVYYGWARMTVEEDCNFMIIKEYALDTTANETIAAGDKCGNYAAITTTAIDPSVPVILCGSDSVTFSTDTIGILSYQWLNDGLPISGANDPAYTTDAEGNYSVRIATPAQCVDTSAVVSVQAFPEPTPPTITQSGDTLVSTEAITYQWNLDNLPVPGATAQTYAPTAGGEYTVTITDTNGCSSTSEPYTFFPTAVGEIDAALVKVYSADQVIFIHFGNEEWNGGVIKIYNAAGQELFASIIESQMMQIDFSNHAAGICVIAIEKGSAHFSVKVDMQ